MIFVRGGQDIFNLKRGFMTDKLKKVIDAKYIWIYGAGKIGSSVAERFSYKQGFSKISGIVVSDLTKQPCRIGEFVVKGIESVSSRADETLFLIAVSSQYQNEVIKKIRDSGYDNYLLWDSELNSNIWYFTKFSYIERKRNLNKVCFVLSGYKEFLWENIFNRLQKYVPDDVEVCILSSGIYNQKLLDISANNDWSYLYTEFNDLTLIQNIALHIYDKAEWIYKMDEDIFLTSGCFEKLYEMYNMVLAEEPYHVGFAAPLIPMNGYGYIHILKYYNLLSEYEDKFEKAKFGGLQTHLLECDSEAARFMWGDGSGLPHIDKINEDFSGSKAYGVCGVRFSIGFVLYRRDFWELMGGFGVSGDADLGRDERELCYYCVIKSRAMIIAHNTVVGHFSFGPQTEKMKEFYAEHPECFLIKEECG